MRQFEWYSKKRTGTVVFHFNPERPEEKDNTYSDPVKNRQRTLMCAHCTHFTLSLTHTQLWVNNSHTVM